MLLFCRVHSNLHRDFRIRPSRLFLRNRPGVYPHIGTRDKSNRADDCETSKSEQDRRLPTGVRSVYPRDRRRQFASAQEKTPSLKLIMGKSTNKHLSCV